MTTVLFRTFGHLTTITRANQLQLEFPGSTVQDFLDALVQRFGEPMRAVLYPRSGELSDLIYILVNGKNIKAIQGRSTLLRDGDVLSVLPVTAGG